MKISVTDLPGVFLIEPRVVRDDRGFFLESWNARALRDQGFDEVFVQDNHSRSRQGVLRGLHYQVRHPQGKLIRVARGAVFDVAVDLRRHSPDFGRWTGMTLTESDQRMLWIPPGFGHGFYVLSEEADFVYKCTDYYDPEGERTIVWNDPDLGIEWPLLAGRPPIVSARDLEGSKFAAAETYE